MEESKSIEVLKECIEEQRERETTNTKLIIKEYVEPIYVPVADVISRSEEQLNFSSLSSILTHLPAGTS